MMMRKLERIREKLARRLILLAINIDPGNKFLSCAGKYNLEIGWRQPMYDQEKQQKLAERILGDEDMFNE